mgnify:CR=1 FL=1
MADKAGGYRGGVEAALADFIGLLGKAILSGIVASLVLALITLGLATTASAQATPNDAKTGTLLFRAGAEGVFLPAPKVETEVMIQVTGIVARTPMQRTGEPRELAGLCLFLASDASAFMTGQIIASDGGWTAW